MRQLVELLDGRGPAQRETTARAGERSQPQRGHHAQARHLAHRRLLSLQIERSQK